MAWLADLPSDLVLLTGDSAALRQYHHVLLAEAVHVTDDVVLVLDGAHCINPQEVGHHHLMHGCPADFAAGRVLIRRAMTPFQWDACLTEDLDAQLHAHRAGLVLAAPYDTQLVREEITDWEQEQYLDWHIQYAKRLAKRHRVPVLWSVDLRCLWHRAPILAARLAEVVPLRRHVEAASAAWRVHNQDGVVLAAPPMRQRRLGDFTTATGPAAPVIHPRARQPMRL